MRKGCNGMKRFMLLITLCLALIVGTATTAFAYNTQNATAVTLYYEYMIVEDRVNDTWDGHLDNAIQQWGVGDCKYDYPYCTGVYIAKVQPEWGYAPDLIVSMVDFPDRAYYAYYTYRKDAPDKLIVNRPKMRTLTNVQQKEVFVHEFGHALKLGHTPCSSAPYSVMTSNCWSNSETPLADDWNGYKFVWIDNNYFTNTSNEQPVTDSEGGLTWYKY